MPLVSICIPTYNTARYLAQAIESVLAQDFSDYELVILDNASTDNTPEICAQYTDRRIRYVRFEELTNQAGNFNRCLNEARGELLTILHSDDCFLAGFLRDRTTRFANDPELGLAFGSVEVIDANGAHISTSSAFPDDRTFAPGTLANELVMACLVSPPSLMVRKTLADAAGQFREDLTWGHDWEWSIRLAERGKAQFAHKALSAYRVHDASGTAEILNAARNGHQERQILREVFARLPSKTREREAYRALSRRQMYFAEQSLLADRPSVARNNLWFAFLADSAVISRPTFWALFAGTISSKQTYLRYRSLRKEVVAQD
jgi:glycosyltransferase involved in cell wall biosynthesis